MQKKMFFLILMSTICNFTLYSAVDDEFTENQLNGNQFNDELAMADANLPEDELNDLGIASNDFRESDAPQREATVQLAKTAQFLVSSELADRLKVLLANEYVLQVKTQNFHWNVTGLSFGPLHSLFDTQYGQLAGFVDLIAERIRALQFFVPGSLSEFKKLATLQEDEGKKLLDKEMIKKLLEGHELIIAEIRADIDLSKSVNDAGTENFLADILVKHEKTAWILRAHLEN